MINLDDQNDLFKLISSNLDQDIECYAFGGNAMMYYGYKKTTKDIDLVFLDKSQKESFVKAIKILGYRKMSLAGIYPSELAEEEHKPEIYTKGDERFDIFLKKIFQTQLNKNMVERMYEKVDFFMKKYRLTVYVLSKEDIILLKSITQRERDFDDILTIVEKESKIDWDYITDQAIEQAKHGDKWIILDLERTMQRLKRHTLIKSHYFKKLHESV